MLIGMMTQESHLGQSMIAKGEPFPEKDPWNALRLK